MERTNLWEDMQRMEEQRNDYMVLTSMNKFKYKASAENPVLGLMLTCRQLYEEILNHLLLTFPFQTQHDGGILRNLGFQDEIVHPFLRSKDVLQSKNVLPQIRKLTLYVRFFRPFSRLGLYKFSPKFHSYSVLQNLTALESIRVCMSFVCIADEDHNLRDVAAWDEWDRIWLAESLLHLLKLIPKNATVSRKAKEYQESSVQCKYQ